MPLGSVSIPGGQKKELGSVDVNEFSQIQVVADGRVGSATGINIRLTITEGSESVRNWSPFRSHLIRGSRGSMTFGKEADFFADPVDRGGGKDALDPANLQKRLINSWPSRGRFLATAIAPWPLKRFTTSEFWGGA
jgi:hypothetical protein